MRVTVYKTDSKNQAIPVDSIDNATSWAVEDSGVLVVGTGLGTNIYGKNQWVKAEVR